MPIDLHRAKEIFLDALQMSVRDRAAYLDSACGGDTTLRQRIEAMLQSQETSGELLPRSPAEMLANEDGTLAGVTVGPSKKSETPSTFVEGETSEPESLSFLTPSSNADCLGRLGHYDVLEVIGKGGFGTVFRAHDTKLRRIVAIKVLAAALAANGSARRRFIREAQASAAIKSEHVVAIHNVEDEHQPPYIVMEMIDGVSLQDRLGKGGPLELKEILRVGMQIAEGLVAAHRQGLVHRDIKPANILLENGVQRVKITDFGLARLLTDDASITQSGVIAGTPMYMAPEQAMGEQLDHRADLFSLGSVLYALCTGHAPFRAANTMAVLKRVCEETPRPIREINPEIPDWLCSIIAKLHAKKAEHRFQSAKEVADVLRQRLADVQSHGRAGSVSDPSFPPHGKGGERGVASVGSTTAHTIEIAPPVSRPRRYGWKLALAVFVLGLAAWRFGPHMVLTASNKAEIRVELDDPDAQLVLSRNGQPVSKHDGTGTIHVLPGTYEVEILSRPGRAVAQLSYFQQTFLTGHYVPHHPPGMKEIYVGRGDYLKLAVSFKADARAVAKDADSALVGNLEAKTPPAEPWVQLFNDKDLTGWTPLGHQGWTVKNGVLHGKGQSGKPGWLMSNQEFGDCELTLEYKLAARTDSGVFLRAWPEGNLYGDDFLEVQLIDEPSFPNLADDRKHGALARRVGPKMSAVAAPGVWHRLKIRNEGTRVQVWNNDSPIVDHVVASLPAKGRLGLQLFPQPIEFRNLRVRELKPAGPHEQPWIQLFNGNDLTGWNTALLTKNQKWHVEDGVIVGQSPGHSLLFSERGDYQNFQLRLEAKVNKGGNSGLFFRAEAAIGQKHPRGYEAQIADGAHDDLTGSLLNFPGNRVKEELVPADTWFVMEVTAIANRITIKVNDKMTADTFDHARRYVKGHLGLQAMGDTIVHFKKIEIKELPPTLTPPEDKTWLPLFNGKDLSNWGTRRNGKWVTPEWPVTADGIQADRVHTIFTPNNFADFHLRVEVKHDEKAAGGILFRRGEDDGDDRPYFIKLRSRGTAASGSLYSHSTKKYLGEVAEADVPAADWYRVEVIAQANRLIVKVANKTVVDVVDDDPKAHRTGRIGLENSGGKSPIQFRNVQIKQMSAIGSLIDDRQFAALKHTCR